METIATVNVRAQTMLAKLLATEDIHVKIGNYSTAFFQPETRVLGLPTWNINNKEASDLLIGHEVGHALYTPVSLLEDFKTQVPGCPFDVLNIVEDIRIERLIQAKYPGLIYSFLKGYEYFILSDFFKIRGQPLDTIKFIDRLNLKAKIGTQVNIPLSNEELAIYNECYAAETPEDVIAMCKKVWKMVKKELAKQKRESIEGNRVGKKKKDEEEVDITEQVQIVSPVDKDADDDESEDDDNEESTSIPKSSDDDESSEEETDEKESAEESEDDDSDVTVDEKESAEESEDDDSDEEEEKTAGNTPLSQDNEPDDDNDFEDYDEEEVSDEEAAEELNSQTLDSVNNSVESLQENTSTLIIQAPELHNIESSIIPFTKVAEARRTMPSYINQISHEVNNNRWQQFKKNKMQNVSILQKEFTRRKAAYQYSRASQATSGNIDPNRLSSYRFDEQIFTSVTTLADAKNHGMVFFIDNSRSMEVCIRPVIRQTLELLFFCRSVGIPFIVYAFTNPLGDVSTMLEEKHIVTTPGHHISMKDTILTELFNSNMSKSVFELAAKEFFFGVRSKYEYMTGTPLNETIIAAHYIVKKFRSKHSVQKMTTIFLTDGEGQSPWVEDNEADSVYRKKFSHGTIYPTKQSILVHGRMISRGTERQIYADLIENLKVTCNTKVIGFYVGSDSSAKFKEDCITMINNSNLFKAEVEKIWNENKSITKFEIVQNIYLNKIKRKRDEYCVCVPGGYNYDMYFMFEGAKQISGMNSDKNKQQLTVIDSGSSVDISQSDRNKLAREFTKAGLNKKAASVFLNKFAEIIA